MAWDIIASKDIEKYMSKSNMIMVDIRESEEYLKGHAPNMVNIRREEILDNLEILDKYDGVIICCERGNSGLKLVIELDKIFLGKKDFYNIYGGYESYEYLNLKSKEQ